MSCFSRLQKLNGEVPMVYEKEQISAVVDFVSDTVDFVVDEINDGIDEIVSAGEFAIDLFESAVEITSDFVEDSIDSAIKFIQDPIGETIDLFVEDFKRDVGAAKATTYLLNQGFLHGDWNAIGQLAIMSISIYATLGGMPLLGYQSFATATLFQQVSIVSTAFGLYNLNSMFSGYSDMINRMGSKQFASILGKLYDMRMAMNLALVNMWINGSMNMWMAGGVLYDSPKAGDLLFNPTGDLNTTKFLNLQNKNQNNWMKWNSGKMHDYQKSVFGNKAGDTFFAVSPLAQRI